MRQPDQTKAIRSLNASEIKKGNEFTIAQLCSVTNLNEQEVSISPGSVVKILEVIGLDGNGPLSGTFSVMIGGKKHSLSSDQLGYFLVEDTE